MTVKSGSKNREFGKNRSTPTAPVIEVDDRARCHPAAVLRRWFWAVRDDFCVDAASAFEDVGLAVGPATAPTLDPPSPEEAFVDLPEQRAVDFAGKRAPSRMW